MKRTFAAVVSAVALVCATSAAAAPGPIAFEASDPLQLGPDMQLGEVAGVAVSADRHIFVFQRGHTVGPAYGAAAAQLLEFLPDGTFEREIGKNLYAWSYAHAVRLDSQGDIWAADKGSDMVIEFTPQGRVKMVVGRKPEASDEDARPLGHPVPPLPPVKGMFRQVTDMTWDSHGNTYISDGYINSRVVKLAPDGRWLTSWGSYGTAPGQFDTLHSIAADAQDRIYVADRGNRRIQVFDTEGKLLRIITLDVPVPADATTLIGPTPGPQTRGTMAPGAPWAVCITPPDAAGHQLLFAADAFPGRIYEMELDGRMIGWLGKTGRQAGEFGWIHEIACPSANELYVGELLNWRVQKLTLHPAS
ncbi:MAG TPA: peptidyl-alpha-hydroxyglycine alpha-amidating lyase family protein [Caulobacteraceae bacterium]|jgi:hypothetical protein|nr:peptidyl-alpha-hydroxyglycine alpha-amidating lyase family protein [Caulobacteraceae bacterium]